ncbi:zf-HC2 domain-containing protein [Pseudonocardia sp. H11422]|uniref:zf-HC2 domain-containing protein n=1 Tax=Pseudonocardia sp. H11422 TaxID=2835866 RepID=UPI002028F53E|nr:zf-HC2 domain-containing protein [Pseudonocardia sp. H11422]
MTDVNCAECREALSARLDGEEHPGEAAAVDAHLEGCAECRLFADRAAHVTRLTRTRVAERGPDLAAAVLAAAPRPRRPRWPAVLRVALGAVGLGQFALAINGVVLAGTSGPAHHGVDLAGASTAHFSNESSAWNLALAVGFLWVAGSSTRASGLVPVVGAFVGVLGALSLMDLLADRVDPSRLAGHGLILVGLVLVIGLRRSRDGGGDLPGRRIGRPAAIGRASDPRSGPAGRIGGEGGGLTPVAQQDAA